MLDCAVTPGLVGQGIKHRGVLWLWIWGVGGHDVWVSQDTAVYCTGNYVVLGKNC